MLDYENQIFLDAFHEDGLVVMAKGLGIERLFVTFLKLYCDPANLVLVLNATAVDELYFREMLENSQIKPLPKIIGSECGVNDRREMYLEGGVLFVSPRILVVDMLIERIPLHLVSGILVYKAHRVLESFQEAFILRLYREKNKAGFIKAFSDNAQSFTAGFAQIERVMKTLFVRHLFIWPRFHADVVSLHEQNKIDVLELHVHLTPAMTACQTALLDLIDACIKELKRGNLALETDEISVEYAITKSFDKVIRRHLDPIWHQLSAKTKQIVADLRTLRLVLDSLTQCDCVNFYNLVNSLRMSEKEFGSNSGWLFTESAEALFIHAKARLFRPATVDDKPKKFKSSVDAALGDQSTPVLDPEECPKWIALKEILAEIDEDMSIEESERKEGEGSQTMIDRQVRVLIAAEDERTCSQLNDYLCEGGKELLTRLYQRHANLRPAAISSSTTTTDPSSAQSINPGHTRTATSTVTDTNSVQSDNSSTASDTSRKKSTRRKSALMKKDPSSLTLTQMIGDNKSEKELSSNTLEPDVSATGSTAPCTSRSACVVTSRPLTVLHPLRGANDPYGLTRTLEELEPRYVILYDSDMTFVRQLEVYKASHPKRALRVYFLMYTGSTEEQRYLTTLRKEKEAFEYLIKQKAIMVVPDEREGRREEDLVRQDHVAANATVNTRRGGVENTVPSTQKIIVDMREFQSELPSLIHRRGIDIEPITIEVGDYILTPDLCVERKSVSDLIGSLNNGRLYNQCMAMCRSYKRPILLIEFDGDKPFTLQDSSRSQSRDKSSTDTMSRLTLLTLHFPRLRLLWCQSPHDTAELFEQLKIGRDQPNTKDAQAITGDGGDGTIENYVGKYNAAPQDMLSKMPGVNSKNIHSIMNHVESIADLATLPLDRLSAIMGSKVHAEQLYSFMHTDCNQTPISATTGTTDNVKKPAPRPRNKRLPLKKPSTKKT